MMMATNPEDLAIVKFSVAISSAHRYYYDDEFDGWIEGARMGSERNGHCISSSQPTNHTNKPTNKTPNRQTDKSASLAADQQTNKTNNA